MTTNEQARSDAMADAETLFRFAFQATEGRRWLEPSASKVRTAYRAAVSDPATVAHAAFRAVPGLRG
jgi:hypothetical protein